MIALFFHNFNKEIVKFSTIHIGIFRIRPKNSRFFKFSTFLHKMIFVEKKRITFPHDSQLLKSVENSLFSTGKSTSFIHKNPYFKGYFDFFNKSTPCGKVSIVDCGN